MSVRLERVLVSDPVHEVCIKLLEQHGIQVTHGIKFTPQELSQRIKDYDGLIVRSETKVTADILEAGAAGRLRLVGRAGTGVDNIDLQAATKHGVYVLNTPGGNSLSACELTCALISAVARNVGAGVDSMKEGRWDRKQLMGSELYGKTLAVIGLGRIGREVAHRMSSYGMTIVGFDPLVNEAQAKDMGVQLFTDLNKLWPLADYITLHVPLNKHTKDLVSAATFSKCKRGVKVINVARGGIINEADLLSALKSGQCGGAGLDVYSEEPPKSQQIWDLVKHPLVTPTPHLGASTVEAQVRVAEEIAEQFVALARPGSQFKVCGAVNSEVLSALSEPCNTGLVALARGMGSLAASLVKLSSGIAFKLDTQSVKESRWVCGCFIEGLVGKTGPGETNLASGEVKSHSYTHTASSSPLNHLTADVETNSLRFIFKGVASDNAAMLMSVDDATFTPGFQLGSRPTLILTQDQNETLKKLFNDGKNVQSVGVAHGKSGTWICVNS